MGITEIIDEVWEENGFAERKWISDDLRFRRRLIKESMKSAIKKYIDSSSA